MFTLGRVAASLAVGFLVAASAGKARAQCAAEADAAKLITDAVPAGQAGVPRWLAETVIRAAEVTGADPAYMLALADKESTFIIKPRLRRRRPRAYFNSWKVPGYGP
jgi:hypothetical protein